MVSGCRNRVTFPERSYRAELGRPEDIADVVGFLASDAARWVTGRVVDATGGSAL
ncbi:SDR family oxidoreductase [Streptomyces sp. CG 926]|uniref:SDR family oxidoreductase n=1 Tax=Streptomyces sp. CG 926 TaxID=1882405 RepID=UPI0028121A57|nr:SDR family oxidoreductase [Streptomyces sp. CG 926]